MLSNRVDKLVLKAYLECPLPDCLSSLEEDSRYRCGEELKSLVNRLLMGRNERIEFLRPTLMSKEDKAAVNALVSSLADEDAKRELVFYYRLAVLAESLLYKYRA